VSRRPSRLQKPFNFADCKLLKEIAYQFKLKLTARRMASFSVPEVRESWIFS
jgi:hypothetical protein